MAGSDETAVCVRPWYTDLSVDDGQVVLSSRERMVVLPAGPAAPLVRRILAQLDGTRTASDLVIDEAARGVRPEATRGIIDLLWRSGVLEHATSDRRHPEALLAFARALGAASDRRPDIPGVAALADRLASMHLVLLGGGPEAESLVALARRSGISPLQRCPWPGTGGVALPGADVVVAVPDRSEWARLGDLNREMLCQARPWMPVIPFDGSVVQVGPLMIPGETCCLECVSVRRAAAAWASDHWLPPGAGGDMWAAPLVDLALATALLQVSRWVCLGDSTLPGRVTLIRPFDGDWHTAPVYRVPRCRACSQADDGQAPWAWAP